MKNLLFTFGLVAFFFFILAFSPTRVIIAQDDGTFLSDSAQADKIDMADLSIKSTDAILDLKKLSDRLIDDETLQEIKRGNIKLLLGMDSLLMIAEKINLENQTSRQLDNNLIFWNQQLSVIGDDLDNITGVLHDLDDKRFTLSSLAMLWKNTKVAADETDMPDAVDKRIDKVLFAIDTTMIKVNKKAKVAMELVTNTSNTEFDIKSMVDRIEGKNSE